MTSVRLCILSTILLLIIFSGSTLAEDWLQWRGPQFNGSTQETGFPDTWSTTENVAWVASVPGDGCATPIISGRRIFVSAQDNDMNLSAMCLDRSTGRTVWKRPMGQGYTHNNQNTAISSSPVTDGKNVFFLYGTGKLAAFTIDSTPLWDMNITERHGKFEILWKYGSSPLLFDNKLYILVLQGNEKNEDQDKSYLLALNPADGKELWKVDRHTPAVFEGKQAYTTPIPWVGPHGSQLLILGANHVTGHDPATGKELWRSPSYNTDNIKYGRTIPSAAIANDMVFVAAPRGMSMHAIQIPEKKTATSTPLSWTWSHPTNSPDVCTALTYNNKLFVLDGVKKVLLCIEPKTGTILGQCKIGGTAAFWASPTGADGKIYALNKKGEVVILSAENTPKILNRIDMDAKNLGSSIALSQGQLFIRLKDKLYCIGKRQNSMPASPSSANDLVISKFSIGGNLIEAEAKITVTPTGRNLSHLNFFTVASNGTFKVVCTSECVNEQPCNVTFNFDRFTAKYLEIRLYDTQGRVIAKWKRSSH